MANNAKHSLAMMTHCYHTIIFDTSQFLHFKIFYCPYIPKTCLCLLSPNTMQFGYFLVKCSNKYFIHLFSTKKSY
ncbi:unnamed protein product [Moneuplotes crassus]|uniref:Uncharacterized protein n=1 Tax=Euplotes crassus TaxID=5936 RepID=A0AAD1U5C8_EUPCR|nr:unnamed protein product [Moneuplotes crassus]